MTFIFWQNIISLHQAAFLKALAKRHEVILVAEQPLTRERAEEGWDLPDMGAVRTVTEPGTAQINRLLENTAIPCTAFPE